MNSINPQSASIDAKRFETRGGERTDAQSSPAELNKEVGGKELPQVEAKDVSETEAVEAEQKKSQLIDAVAQLNDYIQDVQRDLEFTLDETSGRSVISVVDRRSAEVIRQIPAEITLTLAQKLSNEEPLYLFSAQV